MAPRFTDEEMANHLNGIFNETNENNVHITASNFKKPTLDFVRGLFSGILKECGFNLDLKATQLPDEFTGPYEIYRVNDFSARIVLVSSARKYFDNLCQASGENLAACPRFSLDDITVPDAKRIRYFIGHYINFWLFCNIHFDKFNETNERVSDFARKTQEYEMHIKELQKSNEELKMSKASSALKAEKLKGKINEDKAKLAKLTELVQADGEKREEVKKQLIGVKKDKVDLTSKVDDLENQVLRLKSISCAEETKLELESNIESVMGQVHDIMSQVSELKEKEESFTNQVMNWDALLKNMNDLVELFSKAKAVSSDCNVAMKNCKEAHERLEVIESHLQELQKSIEVCKVDIANAKTKWSTNKALREKDLKDYTEKVSTMTKSLTEEDMAYEEMDSKATQAMMETNNLKQELEIEQEKTKEKFMAMVEAYEEFMSKMQREHDLLESAWKKLLM